MKNIFIVILMFVLISCQNKLKIAEPAILFGFGYQENIETLLTRENRELIDKDVLFYTAPNDMRSTPQSFKITKFTYMAGDSGTISYRFVNNEMLYVCNSVPNVKAEDVKSDIAKRYELIDDYLGLYEGPNSTDILVVDCGEEKGCRIWYFYDYDVFHAFTGCYKGLIPDNYVEPKKSKMKLLELLKNDDESVLFYYLNYLVATVQTHHEDETTYDSLGIPTATYYASGFILPTFIRKK